MKMVQTTARAAQQWHPTKYLAFEGHRLRPALELLGRVRALPSEQCGRPEDIKIIDLGAGTGNMASAFMERWPTSHVTFVDSSPSMLERAAKDHADDASLDTSRLTYEQATFDSFEAREPVDLIFSNAAIHWVSAEHHRTLLPRLFSFLKPGGVLAFQIPDSRLQPSHSLMVEAKRQLGLHAELDNVRWVTCEHDPSFYYKIFETLVAPHEMVTSLDMWSTTYAQIMDGENPVADFTSSTGLGPYLEALGGRESAAAQAFERKYRELILQAYPKEQDGRTIFNFKRFFLVAVKPRE
ncbi:hypothetical protein PINS_up005037 [Pythium insidiosum]|nr:hypothetical protein PINS_up005037 [Pythium insidiosum]